MNKKLREIYLPSLRLYLALLFLFTVFTLLVAPWQAAAAEAAAVLIAYGYVCWDRRRRQQEVDKLLEDMTYNIESSTNSMLIRFPLAMAAFSCGDGKVLWGNDAFWNLCGGERQQEKRLGELLPTLSVRWLLDGEEKMPELLALQEREYQLCGHLAGENNGMGVLYFLDVTEREDTRREYQDSRPVEMLIIVDNYEELLKPLSDRQRMELRGRMDDVMEKWSQGMDGLMRRTDRDRYLFLFERRHLPAILQSRFSLLEEIRKVETGSSVQATASIGVGIDGENFAEGFHFASLAAEMALSRGGDQAVVKNRFNFEFYGGRGAEVESRGRVRTRVMAHSLSRLMEEASHIYVMGHRYADLDTIGAAAGICCIARKLGKSANIVLGDGPNASVRLLDRLCVLPEYAETLLSPAEAAARADQNSLLVIVDTNRPEQVEDRAMLECCGKIAIIDHHRRAATYIENPVMSYYEPAASSACELTAEIMERLLDDEDILPEEADAVLSGIVMDTKNFTIRTVERTFAAAAYLQRCGADTTRVKLLLQNGMEETLERYEILRTAKIYRGVAVAVPTTPQNRVVASQAADELLNIHDVTASVVIYPTAAGDIDLSARSIGSINVQVLLEELGGGGNKSAAGAQLGGVTLRDATNRLFAAIDHYLDTDQ